MRKAIVAAAAACMVMGGAGALCVLCASVPSVLKKRARMRRSCLTQRTLRHRGHRANAVEGRALFMPSEPFAALDIQVSG